MAQLETHQPTRIYRGTVDEVFSHRDEIPPGATLELKVFEEASELARQKQAVADILRQWQEHDDVTLFPDTPTRTLFARWAEEDARMTDEERQAEDRLWQEVEKGLNETRATLGMRTL